MSEAGIVIVTHDSAAVIGECLDCAMRTGAEIVVVDNASQDRTVELVKKRNIALISNPQNRGFAAAVNQGIRALKAPFVLLLNPDAYLQTGIEVLVEACRMPHIAGATGKLTDGAGNVQTGFAIRNLPGAAALCAEVVGLNRIWPHNAINWHYRCLGFDFSAPGYAEQPAGAFLLIRRDVWEELHGFDERYFPLWFEDVDYCWRARQKGYRMFYTPNAVAKHTGGHSIGKISLENRQFYWYRSLLGFASRHYRSSTSKLVCLAVFFGAVPRMLAGMVAFRSLTPVVVYGKVMALAGKSFFRQPG